MERIKMDIRKEVLKQLDDLGFVRSTRSSGEFVYWHVLNDVIWFCRTVDLGYGIGWRYMFDKNGKFLYWHNNYEWRPCDPSVKDVATLITLYN